MPASIYPVACVAILGIILANGEAHAELEDTSSKCATLCFDRFEKNDTVKDMDGIFLQTVSIDFISGIGPIKFSNMCALYKKSKSCFKVCPDGETKSEKLAKLTLLEYMCADKYDDYKKSLACIFEKQSVIKEKCKSECQKTPQDLLVYWSQISQWDSPMKNPFEDEKKVSDVCDFGNCYIGCSSKYHKECDPHLQPYVKDVQENMLRQAIMSTVERYYKKSHVPKDLYPEQCKLLASGNALMPTLFAFVGLCLALIPRYG